MDYLQSQIQARETEPGTELIVYTASSFEHYYTYDGIDVCGTRVANEIETQIQRLNTSGNNDKSRVTKLSVVGYSLGGLISRYALGLLYQRGLFETIEPVNFAAFASPHVGVLALGTGLASRLFNSIAPFLLAYTSRQLFLTDRLQRDSAGKGRPLLECLADPDLVFYKALQCFRVRALYSNIVNDHRTAWYTSGVDECDPYAANAGRICGPYAPGYGPVVIDHTRQLQLTSLPTATSTGIPNTPTPGEYTENFLRVLVGRVCNWSTVVFNVAVVMPAWFCAFLFNTAYQNISAAFRKRSFIKGHDLLSAFNLVSLEIEGKPDQESEGLLDSDRFHDRPREVLDSVFEAINVNYDHAATEILPDTPDAPFKEKLASTSTDLPEVEELNLTPVQRRIVNNLNSLGWQKFPVHIQRTKLTHAALICRHPDPTFAEGIVIIEHFIKQVFAAA